MTSRKQIRSVLTLAIALMLATQLCVSAASAAVIYSDTFSRTGNLNGSAAEVSPGGETWTSAGWETTGIEGSAILNNNNGAGYLAFTPSAGEVYTLSATIDVTTGHANWFYGIGFTDIALLTGNLPFRGNMPAYLYEGQSGWKAFAESNNGAGSGNVGNGASPAGAVNYAIELDTTAAVWTSNFFVNAVQVGSHAYTTNPTINYVTIGNWFAEFSPPNQGTLDNFVLSDAQSDNNIIPEPSTFVLAMLGLLGLMGMRRRRNR